jgi:hypothetical protein
MSIYPIGDRFTTIVGVHKEIYFFCKHLLIVSKHLKNKNRFLNFENFFYRTVFFRGLLDKMPIPAQD